MANHKSSPTPPVVIFIHQRAELVRGLMERIKIHTPEKMWIIADGPKSDVGAEAKDLCIEARREAEHGVRWPCKVRRVYADINLGLRARIETGLDAVFRVEEEAILLEEDCHPGPDFFPFCREMLHRYRTNTLVGCVSGNCYLPIKANLDSSYFYSRYPQIWGWATWARAWNAYDRSRWYWPQGGYEEYFPGSPKEEAEYWDTLMKRVEKMEIQTWDYPWISFLFWKKWVCVTPAQNLVKNVGIGPGATHTLDPKVDPGWARQERLNPPYRKPAEFHTDQSLDHLVFQNHYRRMSGRSSFWTRLRKNVFRILPLLERKQGHK